MTMATVRPLTIEYDVEQPGASGRPFADSIYLVFPMKGKNGTINGDLQGSPPPPNSIFKGSGDLPGVTSPPPPPPPPGRGPISERKKPTRSQAKALFIPAPHISPSNPSAYAGCHRPKEAPDATAGASLGGQNMFPPSISNQHGIGPNLVDVGFGQKNKLTI